MRRASRASSRAETPRAVAASCAVPGLFAPVRLGGALYLDGGAVDRTFLALHKAWRPERRAVCHLVKNDGVELVQRDGIIDGVYVVKTPRANAKLWGLGDFEGERKAAEELSKRSLAALANLIGRASSESARSSWPPSSASKSTTSSSVASASGAGNGGLAPDLERPAGHGLYCLSNLCRGALKPSPCRVVPAFATCA